MIIYCYVKQQSVFVIFFAECSGIGIIYLQSVYTRKRMGKVKGNKPLVVLTGDCLGYVKCVSTKARPRAAQSEDAKGGSATVDLDDMHERHVVRKFESVALSREESARYQSHRQRGVVKMCFSGKGEEQQKCAVALASGEIGSSILVRQRFRPKTS